MANLSDRMRNEWNERATIDPLHHVLNRKKIGEWNEADFYATGDENAVKFLEPFSAAQGLDFSTMRALEIGCGAGRETDELAARFMHVTALDVSDEMLNVARQHVTAQNVLFARGNGVNLNVVPDDSVNFVYSFIVFQHIPDVEVQYTYMREIARVLRPGGWFLIHLYADETGYAQKLAAWRERAETGDLKNWDESARRELDGNRFETSMQTAVNVDKTLAVLADAGLTVVFDQGRDTAAWLVGGHA